MTVPPAPQGPGGENVDQYGIRHIGVTGGVAGGIGQPGFSINTDTRGLLEGTMVMIYQVDPGLPRLPNIPRRGNGHPTDARLKCYKVDASFNNLGECRVTASYIGLEKDPTDPQIEITGSTSETSIVFHPGFPTWAIKTAGKPAKGETKAVLPIYQSWVEKDDQGNFVKFKIGVSPGDLGGVEAYLTPKATVRCTFYTGQASMVKQYQGGLGRASERPGSFPQSLLPETKANWLLTNCSVSEYGTIYKISEEWMLSESGKPWNQYIYGGGQAAGGNGLFTNFIGKWTGINWGSVGGSGTTTKY